MKLFDPETGEVIGQACACGDTETNEDRYSLGIYAGHYCDPCWKKSGYRDEPASAFDPLDAGETW